MDMFQLLTDDHAKIKNGLQQLIKTDGKPLDRDQLSRVCNELLIHMQMEEEYMYPVLEKRDEMIDLIEEAYSEHQTIKDLIMKLEKENLEQKIVIRNLNSILETVVHHIKEEEGEVFPLVQKYCSQSGIKEMGERMSLFKKEKSATHRVSR